MHLNRLDIIYTYIDPHNVEITLQYEIEMQVNLQRERYLISLNKYLFKF